VSRAAILREVPKINLFYSPAAVEGLSLYFRTAAVLRSKLDLLAAAALARS
jgi:hypothetical protein